MSELKEPKEKLSKNSLFAIWIIVITMLLLFYAVTSELPYFWWLNTIGILLGALYSMHEFRQRSKNMPKPVIDKKMTLRQEFFSWLRVGIISVIIATIINVLHQWVKTYFGESSLNILYGISALAVSFFIGYAISWLVWLYRRKTESTPKD